MQTVTVATTAAALVLAAVLPSSVGRALILYFGHFLPAMRLVRAILHPGVHRSLRQIPRQSGPQRCLCCRRIRRRLWRLGYRDKICVFCCCVCRRRRFCRVRGGDPAFRPAARPAFRNPRSPLPFGDGAKVPRTSYRLLDGIA